MHDQQTIDRFIQLRAEGRTFAQIAADLNVGKRTLIRWSRQCQCEIQNLRAIESEAQLAPVLAVRPQRLQNLLQTLERIESELARRDLSELSTSRLVALACRLRAETRKESSPVRFSESTRVLPPDEAAQHADSIHWHA